MKSALVPLLQAGCAGLLLLATVPFLLPSGGNAVLWLMLCLPVLLVLPRLHRRESRPLQWLGFLVLFHFTVAVLLMFSPEPAHRWLGALTLACCCLLFPLAIVRLRALRHDKE